MIQDPKSVGAKGENPFIRIEPNTSLKLLILASTAKDWVFFKRCFETKAVYSPHENVAADNVKWRFRVNAVVSEAGKKPEVKILEHGSQVYEQLFDLSKEYDLSSTVIVISRSGSGIGTRYKVMPASQQPSGDAIAKLKEMPKREIHPDKDKEFESDGTQTPNGFASENVPPPAEEFAPTPDGLDEVSF